MDGSEGSFEASVTDTRPLGSDVTLGGDGTHVDAHTGPPYPIILHHGFAGFRSIGPLEYYYHVANDLRAHGETVFEAEVSPFDTPEVRGRELAAYVDQVLAMTGSDKVVIIGHSQGGLDARYMISSLGYGNRVAVLITVATPHRGTKIADVILGNIPGITDPIINAVASIFGWAYNDIRTNADLRAAGDALTVSGAAAFNQHNPDDPRVVYWSVAGRSNQRTGDAECSPSRFPNDPTMVDTTTILLAPFADFLEQGDPVAHVNDGLVEVASAKWGYFLGCIPGDHFDEVGQIAHDGPDPDSGWNHLVFYEHLVQFTHQQGY
jgi:triacylglycerol lipase